MRVNRRKTIAMRSPSSTPALSEGKVVGTITHHAIPPSTFSTPSLQSLIYATSNDRYPGAPGTSLHRAKVEAARAIAASKREIQKELERREEMKRLGILGVGKKRVAGGGGSAASNGGNSRYSTPPATTERVRRGQAAAAAAAANASNGHQHPAIATASSASSSSTTTGSAPASTRPPRSNGRSIAANAIDHNALPVPSNAAATIGPTGSPLLTSSGRLRRPASSSRGASPMPLTSQSGAHINGTGTLSSRTRSPIVTPIDLGGAHSPVRGEDASVSMTVVG